MAELRDILKVDNHTLIIQNVDPLKNISRKDTVLDISKVQGAIPRQNSTNFYYVKLIFSSSDLSFENLDELNDLTQNPTIFPKAIKRKNNDYITGYTCNNPIIDNSGLYYDLNGSTHEITSILLKNGTRHSLDNDKDYTSNSIRLDEHIFNQNDNRFDSNREMNPGDGVKIINKPNNSLSGYQLNFYLYGVENALNVYYLDNLR